MLRLSKSKMMLGLQCHKRLWWTYHERDAPELEIDAATQAIFDQGHLVGEAAQRFYPGGELVEVRGPGGPKAAVEKTRELLDAGITTIYEASFSEDGVFVAIDILRQVDGVWILGEVKSTLSAKPQHIRDAAIQAWVARQAGVDVQVIEIVHLNREHEHPDTNPLFVEVDVTDEAEAFLPEIADEVAAQKEMLGEPVPDIDAGLHCNKPYACPFMERCNEPYPRFHVTELYRIGRKAAALEAAGHPLITDIPDDYKLSVVNRRLRKAVLSDGVVIDSGLREALDDITGSVCYLDFETINPALPAWIGQSPYQQMTVQFSVHRRTPDSIEHEAYLAEGSQDPRPALAAALLGATRGYDVVFAYFASFERGRIEELALACPTLADELTALADRLVDLLPIVREHVGHPDFKGSFSLKKVAPALVSSGYEDLAVADGGTAANLLKRLLLDPASIEADPDLDIDELRVQLLAYCERDTEVLVKLHDELERLADL